MSMTIFDAWHIGKPQSIYDLTIMARCVQGIQEETRAADIAEDVFLLPCCRGSEALLSSSEMTRRMNLPFSSAARSTPSYCGIRGEPHGYSRLRSAKAWRSS